MASPWDDCPKKHFVREEGWVPSAQAVRSALRPLRPLKMFTFCAEHATDIFTLLCRGALALENGKFSNIVFCEGDPETSVRIQSALPMAVAIPMELQQVVCLSPEEDSLANDANYDPFTGVAKGKQSRASQDRDYRIQLHRLLRERFPFDVLNLDLCGFLFKNRERFPGTTFRTLRRMFKWQYEASVRESIGRCCIWLTAKVGPDDLDDSYIGDLIEVLRQNANSNPNLEAVIGAQLSGRTIEDVAKQEFSTFFKVALPKQLASMLHQEGWAIIPEESQVFLFTREAADEGKYEMLHIVLVVEPHVVARQEWGATEPAAVRDRYFQGVESLLSLTPQDLDVIRGDLYAVKLEEIKAFRREQWPDTLV